MHLGHCGSSWPSGSLAPPVALETLGNWYWIVDEIEQADCRPRLVHAGKAKLMLGMVNKTDKLDARELNKLQRIGTLPKVWIPPGKLQDRRKLTHTRMTLFSRMKAIKPSRWMGDLNFTGSLRRGVRGGV